MKKSLIALSALSLSACTPTNNPITPSNITSFEATVIADAEALCSVEPVVADIALLFPAYGTIPAAAASAICAAVNAAPKIAGAKGVHAVKVNGHTIHFTHT